MILRVVVKIKNDMLVCGVVMLINCIKKEI